MSNNSLFGDGLFGGSAYEAQGPLSAKFLVPPMSILSGNGGEWLTRKRAWLAMGLEGEAGRTEDILFEQEALNKLTGGKMKTGTSVFDPVLCEVLYEWFSCTSDNVLDPFAGGVTRGAVAAALGRKYFGVDLRHEQVAANEEQWAMLRKKMGLTGDYIPGLSLCYRVGEHWLKREDLVRVAGVRGGKVRSCWRLAQGAKALTTASSRNSPQANIVASIAARLGIPSHLHIPTGELGPELACAAGKPGANIHQHTAGYNSVIIARANAMVTENPDILYVPFGMECAEAAESAAEQVANIPDFIQRIVVPVGSGMTLAGILRGIVRHRKPFKVLGVAVGADPMKRIAKWAPQGWEELCEIVRSPLDYDDLPGVCSLNDVTLDPIYEAKCLEFMVPGDLLWSVGIREVHDDLDSLDPIWRAADSVDIRNVVGSGFDFMLSCPPYGDLEVYSDSPRDVSNMEWPQFLEAYNKIIINSTSLLENNRFAVFVVGNYRDPRGYVRDLVGETIKAFTNAGLNYYNELHYVTPMGSLPVRTSFFFDRSRKVGRTHQTVLVFVKGDWEPAVQRLKGAMPL